MVNVDPGTTPAQPAAATQPAPAPVPAPAPAPGADLRREEAAEPGGSLVPAAIALTAGVVGLGIGAATGALALARRSELDALCPERQCGQGSVDGLKDAAAMHAEARTLGTVSTWSFVAGGAATALGVTLALVRAGGAPERGAEIGIGPASIRLRGRF
jgi:hypothetical protein